MHSSQRIRQRLAESEWHGNGTESEAANPDFWSRVLAQCECPRCAVLTRDVAAGSALRQVRPTHISVSSRDRGQRWYSVQEVVWAAGCSDSNELAFRCIVGPKRSRATCRSTLPPPTSSCFCGTAFLRNGYPPQEIDSCCSAIEIWCPVGERIDAYRLRRR